MTRHHAESNNILLTRNLPFDSDFRQRSHSLMIPLPCSWAKSNRMHGQFEYDVTWFCFCFILFVRIHGAVVVPQFVSQGEGSGGESWGEGLENYSFHGRHMCIVPYMLSFPGIQFLLQSDTTYISSSDQSTVDFLPTHVTNVL